MHNDCNYDRTILEDYGKNIQNWTHFLKYYQEIPSQQFKRHKYSNIASKISTWVRKLSLVAGFFLSWWVHMLKVQIWTSRPPHHQLNWSKIFVAKLLLAKHNNCNFPDLFYLVVNKIAWRFLCSIPFWLLWLFCRVLDESSSIIVINVYSCLHD